MRQTTSPPPSSPPAVRRQRLRPWHWVTLLLAAVLALVAAAALLDPQGTHPAYATALRFTRAASGGSEQAARTELSETLQTYADDNCPQGRVSACTDAYTPPEWGGFLNAVFRRAQPDGPDAWDVLLLATYEEGQGFSGVCIYNRVEQVSDDRWQVTRWAGWISCDEPNAGLSALAGPDAPNRAP